MTAALESDVLDQAKVGSLLAELIAIEVWDAAYWRNGHPEVYETMALMTRRKRRSEIIRQMVAARRSSLAKTRVSVIAPVTDS